MANEKRLIYVEPIKKFIVDRLNSKNAMEAFGYDAIEILAQIEYAPTVDAVIVVHGQWETYPDSAHLRCTNCKREFEIAKMPSTRNYCPNCGAKMDEKEALANGTE